MENELYEIIEFHKLMGACINDLASGSYPTTIK